MATEQEIFQEVAQILSDSSPRDWTACRLMARVEDEWGEVFCYASTLGAGEKEFYPGSESNYRLYELLDELRTLMRHANHPPWNKVEFGLHAQGGFKVQYQYEEASEE